MPKYFILTDRRGGIPQAGPTARRIEPGVRLSAYDRDLGWPHIRVYRRHFEALFQGAHLVSDPADFPPRLWRVEVPAGNMYNHDRADASTARLAIVEAERPLSGLLGKDCALPLAFLEALSRLSDEAWWRLHMVTTSRGVIDPLHGWAGGRAASVVEKIPYPAKQGLHNLGTLGMKLSFAAHRKYSFTTSGLPYDQLLGKAIADVMQLLALGETAPEELRAETFGLFEKVLGSGFSEAAFASISARPKVPPPAISLAPTVPVVSTPPAYAAMEL